MWLRAQTPESTSFEYSEPAALVLSRHPLPAMPACGHKADPYVCIPLRGLPLQGRGAG